jgi:hypothetical protein
MIEYHSATNSTSTAVLERRAWVRRSCNLETSGRATTAMREVHWFGTLLEVSPGGVRLSLNRSFEIGAVLEIEVSTEEGAEQPPVLRARVIHATCGDDGLWLLGCALDQVLSAREIAAVLGEDPEDETP